MNNCSFRCGSVHAIVIKTNGISNTRQELNPGQEPHRGTIARLFALQAYPGAYARIAENGKTAAVGLTVVAGRSAAVYDLITAPEFRRKGYAGKLLRALLGRAARNGAREAFLQVLADNQAAVALYGKHGFREVYRQWYRVQPPLC